MPAIGGCGNDPENRQKRTGGIVGLRTDSNGARLSRRMLIAGLLACGATAMARADAPATSIRPRPRPQGGNPASAGAIMPNAAPNAAQAAARPDARALIEAARLGGRTSYALIDARTGALIEGIAPEQSQPPASVAKAVTALYALERLGANHTWTTSLIATGPIQGGVLRGDLVLAGGGDPTLSTDDLAGLVARLTQAGVSRISGDFLVHAGALPQILEIDEAQPAHVGYNPAISGLNLNFNRVHVEWKRAKNGWQIGADARGQNTVPRVSRIRANVANRDTPLFTYARDGNGETWTVAASALSGNGSRWLPVRDPALYAGEVFQTLAAARGITLPAPRLARGPIGGTTIARHASAPLTIILRDMLRHSTNLTAEVVGLSASGAGSLQASAAAMNGWARARHGVEVSFVDHSGLGGGSRISAQSMAILMARNPHLQDLLRLFRTGEKNQGLEIPSKTGTLNFVSGLGGFIPGRRPMCFAIFSSDTSRRDALRGAERERPAGGSEWTRRARRLQGQLLEDWAARHG